MFVNTIKEQNIIYQKYIRRNAGSQRKIERIRKIVEEDYKRRNNPTSY